VAPQRLPVRKIREVLRLKAAGFSDRKIAAAIGSAPSTVQECIRRACAAGLARRAAPRPRAPPLQNQRTVDERLPSARKSRYRVTPADIDRNTGPASIGTVARLRRNPHRAMVGYLIISARIRRYAQHLGRVSLIGCNSWPVVEEPFVVVRTDEAKTDCQIQR
jgi:hypothetical protein